MSVEAPISGASIGVTTSSAVSAEAPSFSNFSSISIETHAMTSGISQTGIAPEFSSIGSFQDGGIISQENPFGIQAMERPEGLSEETPRVIAEAIEITGREFARPFPQAGTIFSSVNLSQSSIEAPKITESPAVTEISQSISKELVAEVLAEEVLADVSPATIDTFLTEQAFIETADLSEIAVETTVEELITQFEEQTVINAVSEVAQAETEADIAQAEKVIAIIEELGLEDELMPQIRPVLEKKGLTVEETQFMVDEDAGREISGMVEAEDKDVSPQTEYKLDSDAFVKRRAAGEKAALEAFKVKEEDGKVTGEDIVRRMPSVKPDLQSKINIEGDPTYEEYVRADIEKYGPLSSVEEAELVLEEVNRKHRPVALGTGESVTDEEVHKVLEGKKHLSKPGFSISSESTR